MTHAATAQEVEQALKRAELMIGDPRIDVRWMAECINKLVEALVEIRKECKSADDPERRLCIIGDLITGELADYRGTNFYSFTAIAANITFTHCRHHSQTVEVTKEYAQKPKWFEFTQGKRFTCESCGEPFTAESGQFSTQALADYRGTKE